MDAALVGQTVTLRYDPTRLTRGVTVVVQGRAIGTATRVDAYEWFGLVEMAVFIVILALGLLYAWKKKVLRWV